MGFKGFSLKLFNADSKASPTARPDMKKKSASENEPREALPVVANSPSDEFASNSKFERPNDRPEASRKSPRKREDRAFEDDEVMRGPKPFPDKSPMDKPVLKLFLKSSDNMGKIDAFSSPSSSIMEKKEAPTLLRLRIGSGEEKLPKQETAALLIEDLVPVSEPNRPSIPVKAVSKSKKKKQQVQLEISEEPVVKQKRPYKKTVETKEEPKDIFTEPKGKKAKKEQDAKAVKVKKEKKEKKEKKTKSFPVKDKVVDAVQKEKKTRRSKKQMAAEAAAEEPLPVVAGETFVSEAVEVQHVSPTAGIVNEDFCAACKNTGYFICCETCPNSFHLACVFPPLANVPEESWQCIDCLKTRPVKKLDAEIIDAQAIVSSSNEIENYRAMWDRVWAMSILSEPSAFTLPKRLRPKKDLPLSLELLDESAYQVQPKRRSSVADMRKISSSASLTRRSTSNRNTTTAPAPSLSRRISENGQCHHCGLRSVIPELLPLRAEPIIPKPLIRCDGCPLLWHMDCLDPPLTVLPSAEKRWLCPAHVKLPVYPSFIPEVDLEDNDPFAYEMATRLCALPPPPAERIRLSESSILLDFGAKARRLREESKLNPLLPPPEVVSSYAILTESIHNVASL